MSKSIMQTKKECFLCRYKYNLVGYDGELPSWGLHRHHVVFGNANRELSERYGLWVYVCAEKHHEHGEEAPHQNREAAEILIREAQRIFEENYSHDKWMEVFGKDWL